MTRRPDPWEKRPDESDPAFLAFTTYRDLGLLRSLSKAAAQLRKPKRTLEQWSSKHHWRIRVNAWDGEVDRIERLELIDQRRQMRQRHQQLAVDLQEKVILVLDQFEDDPELAARLLADPNAVARWVDVSTKLERTALGEPEQHTLTVRNGGKADDPDELDFDQLSDEEIQARMVELQREISGALGEYEAAYAVHDDPVDDE